MTGRGSLAAYVLMLFLCGCAAFYKKLKSIGSAFMLVTLCLAAFLILTAIYSPYRVNGMSMYPSYVPGQIVYTEQVEGPEDVAMGDVVVFYQASVSEYLVKRIEGLPGDTVDIQGGMLIVNGEKRDEGLELMESPGDIPLPVTLGSDEFFVLGDNRNNSRDSREFGPVRFSSIIGRVKPVQTASSKE